MANLPSKDASILIVGAGVFGLSTALELAQQGYKKIKVLDRGAEIPSAYSAGCDLNKIVRAEYENSFYTDLALESIRQWQSPFYATCYRHLGYVLATSAASPQKARDTLAKAFSSIENHPAFPDGSFLPIASAADVKAFAPQLDGPMIGWEGYINKHAGYARASKALTKVYEACIDLGVSFVMGDDGHATGVLYEESGKSKQCIGVKAKSGTMHFADKTILCLGAYIAKLVPTIAAQITAKSWAVAHLQLTPEEVKSMIGIPVVNCRDLGFFFEPDEETGLMKLCAHSAGYTNYEGGASVPSEGPNDRIPEEDERKIRQLIIETMPQFAGRPLVNRFICWCADTVDSEYIIDAVPGCKDLMVVAGDSGHAFKMLPIAGRWARALLEDGEQKVQRWKWKTQINESSEDISWRVGKLRDVKEVAEWAKSSKL
ncbi:hypothetical protein BP6252_08958 [Coleophoma cylindrospora]|uniref:FAD dependent oxidoreductase domain-containing protein n=1 Tax=Coleophoma cylindrospora TaxID=1849047 RepID=A0A3D8R0I4_9HELO|nr:hypothetical protein BP6252_08958 [Coleophoma cylindrospora]